MAEGILAFFYGPLLDLLLLARSHRYRYACRLCGKYFDDLSSLIAHFEREHSDLPDVKNWRVFRLHGLRYGAWRKYRDLRYSGFAERVLEVTVG